MSAQSITLPKSATELRGTRVLVRPYRPDDVPEVFQAIQESRDRIKFWLPWAEQGHKKLADTEDFVQRAAREWEERTQLVYGMWDVETGRFVGGTGIHCRDWAVPFFEIGYWTREGDVGKGYVREAVQLQTRFVFEELGANRVEICCDSRNDRSRRIPEILGFQLEATIRNHMRDADGGLRDTLVFAMTPDVYDQVKGAWS